MRASGPDDVDLGVSARHRVLRDHDLALGMLTHTVQPALQLDLLAALGTPRVDEIARPAHVDPPECGAAERGREERQQDPAQDPAAEIRIANRALVATVPGQHLEQVRGPVEIGAHAQDVALHQLTPDVRVEARERHGGVGAQVLGARALRDAAQVVQARVPEAGGVGDRVDEHAALAAAGPFGELHHLGERVLAASVRSVGEHDHHAAPRQIRPAPQHLDGPVDAVVDPGRGGLELGVEPVDRAPHLGPIRREVRRLLHVAGERDDGDAIPVSDPLEQGERGLLDLGQRLAHGRAGVEYEHDPEAALGGLEQVGLDVVGRDAALVLAHDEVLRLERADGGATAGERAHVELDGVAVRRNPGVVDVEGRDALALEIRRLGERRARGGCERKGEPEPPSRDHGTTSSTNVEGLVAPSVTRSLSWRVSCVSTGTSFTKVAFSARIGWITK